MMFFYVDESGHTGTNLFDKNQPFLAYGVLSAKTNLDLLAESKVKQARSIVGADRLHGSVLGLGGLVKISNHLISIQERYHARFDLYLVAKADYAVICFFDQVFDQGVNPAMTWSGYWTPLRYLLLLKVSVLFDDDLAQRAWRARIDINNASAESEMVSVCRALIARLSRLPDARSRELIGDSLSWAISHPHDIHYNCESPKEVLQVAPNIIGFQIVMHGIAARLTRAKPNAKIVVDQQSQFNKEQKNLAQFYATTPLQKWVIGPGLPQMDLSNMPKAPILVRSSKDSVGLELVDCYLWLFNKMINDGRVPGELAPIIKSQFNRGRMDEISISKIAARWVPWFNGLPNQTEDEVRLAKEMLAEDEERRLLSVKGISETIDSTYRDIRET